MILYVYQNGDTTNTECKENFEEQSFCQASCLLFAIWIECRERLAVSPSREPWLDRINSCINCVTVYTNACLAFTNLSHWNGKYEEEIFTVCLMAKSWMKIYGEQEYDILQASFAELSPKFLFFLPCSTPPTIFAKRRSHKSPFSAQQI